MQPLKEVTDCLCYEEEFLVTFIKQLTCLSQFVELCVSEKDYFKKLYVYFHDFFGVWAVF